MNALRNLTIRGKVLLVVTSGLFFQAIITAVGLYYLDVSSANLGSTIVVETNAIIQAAVVRADYFNMVIAEKNMIISKDEEEEAKHRAEFDSHQRALEEDLAKLRNFDLGVADRHIDDFGREYRAYLEVHQTVRGLSAQNIDLEAMALSVGIGTEKAEAARKSLTGLMDNLEASLAQRNRDNTENAKAASFLIIGFFFVTILCSGTLGLLVTTDVKKRLGSLVRLADSIAGGDLDTPVDFRGTDEVAQLALSIDSMQSALKAGRKLTDDHEWLNTGLTRLSSAMLGEKNLRSLATTVITEVATYLKASVGAFYVYQEQNEERSLALLGSYACTRRKNLSNEFLLGEGLVGQAGLEQKQILISNVPDDYIKVVSGLGEALPRNICVTPLLFENQLVGVMELASLEQFDDLELNYLSEVASMVAISVDSAHSRERLRVELERSQSLTEELQVQQKELQSSNEELEEQSLRLKTSQGQLQAQQEEMEVINEELEEKNERLERQKQRVEQARREIAQKAEELAQASKYKSQFLANMSHELRTPLNSLLLLARGLSDNKDENLTPQQIESSRVIYQSGTDLLSIINEILDLSKIEAGRVEIKTAIVSVSDLANSTRDSFAHLAEERGLALTIEVKNEVPETIVTDRQRMEQIIRNLVSNAIRFTEKGGVKVTFGLADPKVLLETSAPAEGKVLAISISDSGIGISPDQHKLIFEAFQQVDGRASRRVEGTGLGLPIARELAHLLGGEIQVRSEIEKGSTFTVYLPISERPNEKSGSGKSAFSASAPPVASGKTKTETSIVPDDRETIQAGDKVILVIEDDARFSALLEKECHKRALKCLVACDGETGLDLARRFLPGGIILDIKLPGLDGWGVLEVLKDDPKVRHIPVHIISGEEPSTEALRKGAVGQIRKPVTIESIDATLKKLEEVAAPRLKRVLVVEDNKEMRRSIAELIEDEEVQVVEAENAGEATEALKTQAFDCMILDLGLWDMDGEQLLKQLNQDQQIEVPPVIVHTGRDMTRQEEMELRAYSDSIIIKDVRSEERLLDEVSLFLHRVVAEMPEKKRQVITNLHDSDGSVRGKKVLVVDDDMRTVYALSKVLSDRGMNVLKAENGDRAVKILAEEPDVDLVLMDLMMPVMDGLEALRRIREQDRFLHLPVIALTAKAMAGDQKQCMEAGANDYLPKPVDQDRLLSMMRVWLYR